MDVLIILILEKIFVWLFQRSVLQLLQCICGISLVIILNVFVACLSGSHCSKTVSFSAGCFQV